MERCPSCSARCTGDSVCRRCGMDLGLLLRTEESAEILMARAVLDLKAGHPDAARRTLLRSLALKRTALAERLLGFARDTAPR